MVTEYFIPRIVNPRIFNDELFIPFNTLGLKSSWLKSLGLKSPRLKCPSTTYRVSHIKMDKTKTELSCQVSRGFGEDEFPYRHNNLFFSRLQEISLSMWIFPHLEVLFIA